MDTSASASSGVDDDICKCRSCSCVAKEPLSFYHCARLAKSGGDLITYRIPSDLRNERSFDPQLGQLHYVVGDTLEDTVGVYVVGDNVGDNVGAVVGTVVVGDIVGDIVGVDEDGAYVGEAVGNDAWRNCW